MLLLSAAVCAGAAQPARLVSVGDINFYGLRKVTAERILGATNLKVGAALPPSKGDLEDAIEKIPGVVLARVEAVCCEGSQVSMFIGIEEKGAPHAGFRSEPAGSDTLPDEVMDSYRQFLVAVGRAASRGNDGEDLTAGHSRMAAPEARAFQEGFIAFAGEHVDALRAVLRNASDPEQRAVAAAMIGYAPAKRQVTDDLQFALQDPEEAVRANAARSLMAIAVLAGKQPELGIRISATWFVELLNSVVLSDRFESAKTLLTLTDRANPSALDLIRERSVPSLVEMARWKTPRYAVPAFLLLGRVAGMADDEVQKAWEQENRELVIRKAQGR